jgi:hypothetical protein
VSLRKVGRAVPDGTSHNLHLLNEHDWALNVFWLPAGREEGVGLKAASPPPSGQSVWHPDRWLHAGTRWVTERIASPDGEDCIRTKQK